MSPSCSSCLTSSSSTLDGSCFSVVWSVTRCSWCLCEWCDESVGSRGRQRLAELPGLGGGAPLPFLRCSRDCFLGCGRRTAVAVGAAGDVGAGDAPLRLSPPEPSPPSPPPPFRFFFSASRFSFAANAGVPGAG